MWMRTVRTRKITEDGLRKTEDKLIMETTHSVKINDENPVAFMTTPQDHQALAIGYAAVHFGVRQLSDISLLETENGETVITCMPKDQNVMALPNLGLAKLDIIHIAAQVQEKSMLYRDTAITHSVALSDAATVVSFAEDVSGINALYKAIGQAILLELDLSGLALFTTDRFDSGIMQVLSKFPFPILISRTGITDMALDSAESHHRTVVGFARKRRFSVFADRDQRLNLS